MSDMIATENYVDGATNDRIATELYANPAEGVAGRIATEDWVDANPSSAFPVPEIVTDEVTGSSGTSDLPGSIVAGDLIMIIIGYASANVGLNLPGGWTAIVNATTTNGLIVCYKFAAGGETGFAWSTGNGTSRTITSWAAKFNGTAHASTPPAAGAAEWDPPSLNPANWDVEKTLWLATGYPTNAYSTGFGLYQFVNNGLRVCGKEEEVASQDPSTMSSPTDNWQATLAIRPAA